MNSLGLKYSQSGFTLIEVLISIVLMAFVAFTTIQLTDSSITTRDNVTKEDRELMQIVTLMNRLEADFQEYYTPLFFDPNNTGVVTNQNTDYTENPDTSYFEGNKNFYNKTKNGYLVPFVTSEDKTSIIFFSSTHRRRVEGKKESRYAWIKYSLRSSDKDEDSENERATNELVRQYYVEDIYSKDIDWSKVPSQVILRNIKDLEFMFFDERSKKFTNSINDLNENRYKIKLLKIKLTWVDPDKNEQKFEKNFRPLWPNFNTKLDDANNSSPNLNPFDNNSSGTNPDGGFN